MITDDDHRAPLDADDIENLAMARLAMALRAQRIDDEHDNDKD